MKIVLSPNPYRDRGLRAVQNAERILRGVGMETCMCLPFPLDKNSRMEFPKNLVFQENVRTLEEVLYVPERKR